MFHESQRLNLGKDNLEGGILLDEMAVQKDLQVVRRGDKWQLMGAVDLGDLSNDIELFHLRRRR